MELYVSGRQMQIIDQLSIHETGIPSLVLMERAALSVALEILALPKEKRRLVLCVCGSGNNGADGIAIARILCLKGQKVHILTVGNEAHATEEWKCQMGIAKNLGIEVSAYAELAPVYSMKNASFQTVPFQEICIVDAIFGIGLNRELSHEYRRLVEDLNQVRQKGAVTVAVDIPSGLLADTGQPAGAAVSADITVTFGYKKAGQILSPGYALCGRLVLSDCGFDPQAFLTAGNSAFGYRKEELPRYLPKRQRDGHKGTFGRVLVIAGNADMSGAACFSAMACMRCGCGLVKVFTVKENREIIHNYVPEAILSVYDSKEPDLLRLSEAVEWADAVVFGPGMGQEAHVKQMLSFLLKGMEEGRFSKPLLIDADGLRILGTDEAMKAMLNGHCVLTPHIGELTALTGKSQKELFEDLPAHTEAFAEETGAVLVAKCARTLVSTRGQASYYINTSGSDALATAGSGDVLTGIIAAFLTRISDPAQAARLGVFVHGLAGEEAERRLGSASFVMARDIIDGIAGVLSQT